MAEDCRESSEILTRIPGSFSVASRWLFLNRCNNLNKRDEDMSEKTNQANFTARLPRGAAVRRLADMQLIVYDLIICKDLFTLIDKQPIQGYCRCRSKSVVIC